LQRFLHGRYLMNRDCASSVGASHGRGRVATEEREHRDSLGKRSFEGVGIQPMQDKVDAERLVGPSADGPDLGDHLVRGPIEASQYAEPTGLANGGNESGRRVLARHASLNDRMRDAEQSEEM
jgi:hypothetical protein